MSYGSLVPVGRFYDCSACFGERGDEDRSCSKCAGTGYDAAVVLDGDAAAVVQLPHGTYRIVTSPLPSGTGHSVAVAGTGTEVHVGRKWDDVKSLRRRTPCRPEELEALMLAVFAFRDQAARKVAKLTGAA